MRKNRITTASLYHSRFLGVTQSEGGSRFGVGEVASSNLVARPFTYPFFSRHSRVDSNSPGVRSEHYRAYPALAMREARFLKASSLTGFTPLAEIQRL